MSNLTAQQRKERPLFRGLMKYFPDALMEVANVSFVANEQHNPGEPMHWSKGKSDDHEDALMRHLKDRVSSKFDEDGLRHLAKASWRALAALQIELESERQERAHRGYLSAEIESKSDG